MNSRNPATVPAASLTATIQRMLSAASLRDGADEDLLRRFLSDHDEAAFHALVRRHGGMVWSVCRGVLRHDADAEDAFQATFILLALKANTVRNPQALAAWLHAVASRIARKALRAKLRRRRHEECARPREEPEDIDDHRVVHEELNALPEKYRVPLVLYYFNGRTQDQAAGALGLSNSGIKKRLARGRELLHSRLTRRGLAGASLSFSVMPVNASLAASTAAVATGYAGGSIAVSAAVLTLIPHGVKAMIAVKLLAVGSLLAATTFGVVLLADEAPKPAAASKASEPPPAAEAKKEASEQPAQPKRQQSQVGDLLTQLEKLNAKSGSDAWASVMKQLIEIGPKAVPELVAELDATNDDAMLRSIPFILRGIGDKRAVPSLIRALPRACRKPASDMGYRSDNAELFAFMQKHDCSIDQDGTQKSTFYSYGRPITELIATLEKLTGQDFGEKEIRSVFLEGTPRQQHLQRLLYQRCAERWTKWWEAHAKDYTHEKEYHLVKLASLAEFVDDAKPTGFPHGPQANIDRRWGSNVIESVRYQEAKFVFYDLDTARESGLPKHLQAAAGQPERLDDILAWAAREGFDLMGTEYKVPGSDKPHYVLRGLGLAAWQIDAQRSKTIETEIKSANKFDMGTRTDGLLANYDQAKGQYSPEEMATFLFQTREGSYGIIYVGAEVHELYKPSKLLRVASPLDNEWSQGFCKGRRFSYVTLSMP